MQNLSFTALSLASNALKHEIDDLERLAADHGAMGCHKVAHHFVKEAARLERARAEINGALGGAQ
jgi:hypothetical protein